ncbi:T9SS type A sorting domain-containing protein [Dyadobacter psychrophilus]|uniref:Por secretion system C-terminal sorting domain-containing protein n=1 Tax=Dyadobacter psychrophilus TaxID=651661 RepID=A0A1T5DTQ8_9BACT|nr:T9SS type A sorting domain-containing protein [Dyadobacter psychrophilus]SKB75167.1 Por secretion system C-terminal sorting domain-containing protein [Dyadobacter psychrophilus]
MKKILTSVTALLLFCAFQTQAQEKIIRSKYGLTIYPTIKRPNPVTIYPNPAKSSIRIRSAKPIIGFDLEVFDQTGLSYLKQPQWNGEAVDVSKLHNGIYIVRFTRGREHYSQKLIVKQER